MSERAIATSAIRKRLLRIIADWRNVPELSALMLAQEYARRHEPDDRARHIANSMVAKLFELRRRIGNARQPPISNPRKSVDR